MLLEIVLKSMMSGAIICDMSLVRNIQSIDANTVIIVNDWDTTTLRRFSDGIVTAEIDSKITPQMNETIEYKIVDFELVEI